MSPMFLCYYLLNQSNKHPIEYSNVSAPWLYLSSRGKDKQMQSNLNENKFQFWLTSS